VHRTVAGEVTIVGALYEFSPKTRDRNLPEDANRKSGCDGPGTGWPSKGACVPPAAHAKVEPVTLADYTPRESTITVVVVRVVVAIAP
jgi:hypothetical protein